ncbi:MAG: HNH endonuclease [Anaerovoracaceae bacterium]
MALKKAQRFRILERDKFTCQYCGRRPPEVRLEVDHFWPRAYGGEDQEGNLVTACRDCNNGKRDHIVSDDAVLTKRFQTGLIDMLQDMMEANGIWPRQEPGSDYSRWEEYERAKSIVKMIERAGYTGRGERFPYNECIRFITNYLQI